MALTADREYATVPRLTYQVKGIAGAADTLFKGAALNWGSDGFLKVAADAANEKFAGINVKQIVAAGSNEEDVVVERGQFWVPHSGAAQTDVGAYFHFAADDVVTDGLPTNPVGAMLCIDWKAGYLLLASDVAVNT